MILQQQALANLSEFLERLPTKTEALVLFTTDISLEDWRETKRWLEKAATAEGVRCE